MERSAKDGSESDDMDRDARLARLEHAGVVVHRTGASPLDVLRESLRPSAEFWKPCSTNGRKNGAKAAGELPGYARP